MDDRASASDTCEPGVGDATASLQRKRKIRDDSDSDGILRNYSCCSDAASLQGESGDAPACLVALKIHDTLSHVLSYLHEEALFQLEETFPKIVDVDQSKYQWLFLQELDANRANKRWQPTEDVREDYRRQRLQRHHQGCEASPDAGEDVTAVPEGEWEEARYRGRNYAWTALFASARASKAAANLDYGRRQMDDDVIPIKDPSVEQPPMSTYWWHSLGDTGLSESHPVFVSLSKVDGSGTSWQGFRHLVWDTDSNTDDVDDDGLPNLARSTTSVKWDDCAEPLDCWAELKGVYDISMAEGELQPRQRQLLERKVTAIMKNLQIVIVDSGTGTFVTNMDDIIGDGDGVGDAIACNFQNRMPIDSYISLVFSPAYMRIDLTDLYPRRAHRQETRT